MKDEVFIPQLWFWVTLEDLAHGGCLVWWPRYFTQLLTVPHFDFLGANCFMLHHAMAFPDGT